MTQTILITGCSTGIGYYCAHALHKSGHQVIATCRDSADVKRLRAEGLRCEPLDIKNSEQIQNLIAQLESEETSIDVLFNNAGYGQPGAVEDVPKSALIEQFQTNVFGTQELTNAIILMMRQQGHGKIIYNSSVLGFAAMPYRGAYNASKYALEGLADTLRLELRGTGIYVSLIEPGPILSEFRNNAEKHFNQNIDAEHSAHKSNYDALKSRLTKVGASAPFTLGPDAVCARVEKIIRTAKPKARYPVTFPTYLFAWLKRVLPTSALDYVLYKAGDGGKR